MGVLWRVTHHLKQAAEVETKLNGYPDSGIALEYNEEEKLSAIVHTIELGVDDTVESAIDQSLTDLFLFLEILFYLWGLPIKIARSSTEQLCEDTSQTAVSLHGIVSAQMDAQIVRPIKFPSKESTQDASPRLRGWFRLANEARDGVSDVDAIRNYYMILEDLKSRSDEPWSLEGIKVKHLRDFVSHGVSLGNAELLKFLKEELGEDTNQFDPTNKKHQQFLRSYREWARRLVDAELTRRITP